MPHVLRLVVVGALFALGSAGCSKTRELPRETLSASQNVSAIAPARSGLQGRFVKVAKRAAGTARFSVTLEGKHQLVLDGVEVETQDPVHVYLVALDEAPTTASVDNTEDKYDVGEFRPGELTQAFDLPSEPDASLRVAVLWNVRFGINLAQAPLR